MISRRLRFRACIGLLLLTSTGSAAEPSEETAGASETAECGRQEDDVQRLACYDARRSAIESEKERAPASILSFSGRFVSHRSNYILPFSWIDNPNRTPESPRLGATAYDFGLDKKEAKYQISFKVPVLTGLLDKKTTLWFGYTQLAFWQIYNTADSAPFRETNFEPELFLQYQADDEIGPGTLTHVTLGLNHQSNGRSEPRSRSWTRILASAAYRYERWQLRIQPWYRLPSSDRENDNQDLERYIGYADYYASYQSNGDNTLTLMLRNNLRTDDNKTSVQLGYSFPLGGVLKGYIQYYNGYGESLIDYNERIHRIGIGLMINDWM